MNQISTYWLLLFLQIMRTTWALIYIYICERTYINVLIYIHTDQLQKRIKNYEKERTAYWSQIFCFRVWHKRKMSVRFQKQLGWSFGKVVYVFQESFHLCRMGLLGTSRQKAVMSAWILFRFTFGGFTPNIAVIAKNLDIRNVLNLGTSKDSLQRSHVVLRSQ